MPIYAPGRRNKHNRPLSGKGKRSVVVMLSLTAMVDMFTVLVVFLLQNYQTTGEVIEISDQVILPKALAVRELKPAFVVVASKEGIMLDKEFVADFLQVKDQADWKIESLFNRLTDRFREAQEKRAGLAGLKQAIDETRPESSRGRPEDDRRVTVQADKDIDFLTIKKIMWTLTEAGASEINFAVLKDERSKEAN